MLGARVADVALNTLCNALVNPFGDAVLVNPFSDAVLVMQ